MSKIYEIFGHDAHSMTMALMERANVIAQIPQGGSVALKPNLVVADDPESGATTHAGVLSGCIAYLQAHGVQDISVIEGSWVGDATMRAMKVCGYDAVCAAYQVPFYDLKKDDTVAVKTPLRTMQICRRAKEADYLINLPVLKGHCQTVMTCALKNCKGCIPDSEKRLFHAQGLFAPIAALGATLRPQLTIVDSICGDLNFEEGGTPIHTNRMYLGFDPVQIDSYGCQLMGIPLEDVPYIGMAEEWGGGSTQVCAEDIVALNAPQQGDIYPEPTGLVRKLTRGVQASAACSACYAALVRALYSSQDASLDCPIYIGQDFRGKTLDGFGVGACCAGASCAVGGCPPSAQEIAQAICTYTDK
ncbi:MAG: DUF362 domain-containing protein [Faecalibacterium sp.]